MSRWELAAAISVAGWVLFHLAATHRLFGYVEALPNYSNRSRWEVYHRWSNRLSIGCFAGIMITLLILGTRQTLSQIAPVADLGYVLGYVSPAGIFRVSSAWIGAPLRWRVLHLEQPVPRLRGAWDSLGPVIALLVAWAGIWGLTACRIFQDPLPLISMLLGFWLVMLVLIWLLLLGRDGWVQKLTPAADPAGLAVDQTVCVEKTRSVPERLNAATESSRALLSGLDVEGVSLAICAAPPSDVQSSTIIELRRAERPNPGGSSVLNPVPQPPDRFVGVVPEPVAHSLHPEETAAVVVAELMYELELGKFRTQKPPSVLVPGIECLAFPALTVTLVWWRPMSIVWISLMVVAVTVWFMRREELNRARVDRRVTVQLEGGRTLLDALQKMVNVLEARSIPGEEPQLEMLRKRIRRLGRRTAGE